MGLCAPEKSLILHKFYNIQHGRMIFFYQTGDEYNVFGLQIILPTYRYNINQIVNNDY